MRPLSVHALLQNGSEIDVCLIALPQIMKTVTNLLILQYVHNEWFIKGIQDF